MKSWCSEIRYCQNTVKQLQHEWPMSSHMTASRTPCPTTYLQTALIRSNYNLIERPTRSCSPAVLYTGVMSAHLTPQVGQNQEITQFFHICLQEKPSKNKKAHTWYLHVCFLPIRGTIHKLRLFGNAQLLPRRRRDAVRRARGTTGASALP